MLENYSPKNPFRTLDWRWQLAGYMVEHPSRRRPRWIDVWARRARRFQLVRQKRLDLGRRFHPERVDRLVHQALEVHNHQPRRRLELEARLLAGQDLQTIAQRLDLPPELIELYGHLFYDVREHLHRHDFIILHILGVAYARGYRTPEEVVRLFAYMRGPAILDGVLEIYDTPEQSVLLSADISRRITLDPLRLAFEVKLLPDGVQLPAPMIRLITLTLGRLMFSQPTATASGGLGGVDLDALLTEHARTGGWDFLKPQSPPDASPIIPKPAGSPSGGRVRYAT